MPKSQDSDLVNLGYSLYTEGFFVLFLMFPRWFQYATMVKNHWSIKRPDWYSETYNGVFSSEGCAYFMFTLEKDCIFICTVEMTTSR